MNADIPSDVLFRLESVTRRGRDGPILRDVTLSLPTGRITSLLGPSGAGKTTLLQLLNRLQDPDGGHIFFDGRPVDTYQVGELRQRVGFVFQSPVMFPGTVRDNLREAAELAGIEPDRFDPTARRAMEQAELDAGLLERDGQELSVGEQQRANLARVLVTGPEVLLLDEPTSALDPPTASRLLTTVERLVEEEGLSVVMATHRLAEARQSADRAVMLAGGEVVESGPASRVLDDPRREETARFVDSVR